MLHVYQGTNPQLIIYLILITKIVRRIYILITPGSQRVKQVQTVLEGYPCFHKSIAFELKEEISHTAIALASQARLLPKKIFREPFGLPKLEIGSPRYISRSPRLFSQIQTMSYETYSLDSNIKKVGYSSRILKLTSTGDQSGRGSRIFLLLKETNLGVAPAFLDR